jgi:hypothetical protein
MSGEERLFNMELLSDLGGLSNNGEGNAGNRNRGLIDFDIVKNLKISSNNGERDGAHEKRGLVDSTSLISGGRGR